MPDWFDVDNDTLKMQMMRDAWGDETPDYVIYALPRPVDAVSQQEHDRIVAELFAGVTLGWGDIELHWSDATSGTDMIPVAGLPGAQRLVILRMRRMSAVPAFVTIDGMCCPMIQFGHRDDASKPGLDGATMKCTNFVREWGWGKGVPPGPPAPDQHGGYCMAP